MRDNLYLLAPRLRNDPRAKEFADYLAGALGGLAKVFDGNGPYAWDAEIPPMTDWCSEAGKLAHHAANL